MPPPILYLIPLDIIHGTLDTCCYSILPTRAIHRRPYISFQTEAVFIVWTLILAQLVESRLKGKPANGLQMSTVWQRQRIFIRTRDHWDHRRPVWSILTLHTKVR